MGKKYKGKFSRRRIWRRRKLIERDGIDCALCRKPMITMKDITIDHWIPKSKGGTNDLANLRLAHPKCNQSKRDLLPEEWLALQEGEDG